MEEKRWREKKYPPHTLSWETMLAWVNEDTRNIAKQLATHVERRFRNVVQEPRGRPFVSLRESQAPKPFSQPSY